MKDFTYTDYVLASMERYYQVSKVESKTRDGRRLMDEDIAVLQELIAVKADNRETDQDLNDYFKNV